MKQIVCMAAFVLLFAGMANAQFLGLGVKLSYGSQNVGALIDTAQNVAANPKTDFLQQCNAGILLRLNIGGHLYLQPEANFAIGELKKSSDSSAVNTETASTFENMSNTFKSIESVSLSIPVLVGWKLFEVENTINMRVFVGPEFYSRASSLKNIDFNTYSVVGGIGFDLLDFLYIDARATYMLSSKQDLIDKKPFFNLSLGLLF